MFGPLRPRHLAAVRPHRLLALVALGCLPLAACGSDDGASTVRSEEGTAGNVTEPTAPVISDPVTSDSVPVDAITTVVYEFHDASVPPEYHRSYTVTVTDGTATVVVDSYGDVIAQDTKPIDAAAWAATTSAAAALAGTPSSEQTGCTGGTADEVTALDGAGAEVVHVFIDHCGDPAPQDLSTVVASVLPLFDLATMTATS